MKLIGINLRSLLINKCHRFPFDDCTIEKLMLQRANGLNTRGQELIICMLEQLQLLLHLLREIGRNPLIICRRNNIQLMVTSTQHAVGNQGGKKSITLGISEFIGTADEISDFRII